MALGKAGALVCLLTFVASAADEVAIYTEHPRLFLRAQRMRLLRRERERKSLRWEQFELLLKGGAPMPEPGLAQALYFRVSDDRDAGRRAIEWAKGPAQDLHQLAIVFDWCQDILTEPENRALTAKLRAGIARLAKDTSLDAARSRLLAAIALADHDSAVSKAEIEKFLSSDWKPRIEALRHGRNSISREEMFALFEILHAVRDNLNDDLRELFPKYFKDLPIYHLLSHYPATFPASDNEFRIPAFRGSGGPDLTQAALSRAAELSMVAFDANSPETQVLQGWLMNDRFLMRGPFGIPYEFLWANPYQPGLSYYHVPLVFHDEVLGRLFVRSSWDESATWMGFFDGELELFKEGKTTVLRAEGARDPVDLEEAIIFFGRQANRFHVPAKEANDAFIVGLQPNRTYKVEIDDEELREVQADPGGILYFPGLPPKVGLRFNP